MRKFQSKGSQFSGRRSDNGSSQSRGKSFKSQSGDSRSSRFSRDGQNDRSDRNTGSRSNSFGDRKPGGFRNDRREGGFSREGGERKFPSRDRNEGGFSREGGERKFPSRDRNEGGFSREGGERSFQSRDRKEGGFSREGGERKFPSRDRKEGGFSREGGERKFPSRDRKEGGFSRENRSFRKPGARRDFGDNDFSKRTGQFSNSKNNYSKPEKISEEGVRLNKYLANSGVCSRREADDLIQAGTVKINGEIVAVLGTRVKPNDIVNYGGQTLNPEERQYILLNKPKGFITTVDDPYERKTVMSLVENACGERIYPVGRLDRLTTGLLLFTNDGDLAKKLTHPSNNVTKIYHVVLNKSVLKRDLEAIVSGIELDDGFIKVDRASYVTDIPTKKEIGIELHSGRNRIVRRIFEHLGYKVEKLDRVSFAGLTKKDVPRGKFRHLRPKEVTFLKHMKNS